MTQIEQATETSEVGAMVLATVLVEGVNKIIDNGAMRCDGHSLSMYTTSQPHFIGREDWRIYPYLCSDQRRRLFVAIDTPTHVVIAAVTISDAPLP